MKQYLNLAKEVLEKGTYKEPARNGMPGTTSLFGYKNEYNFEDGFPIITTKKINLKIIVVELLWFLRGDQNIKYMVDNGCNIWNEDAFNYFEKVCRESGQEYDITFDEFVENVKNGEDDFKDIPEMNGYKWGDTGNQYPKLWRKWKGEHIFGDGKGEFQSQGNRYVSGQREVDQIEMLIEGLKGNPTSRRHIITAWNPAALNDMALNACHALVQFNCRPIPWEEKLEMAMRHPNVDMENLAITEAASGNPHYGPIPQYYLDCQIYQRSADLFLGVPFNISSYSLLTYIISIITGLKPGSFHHAFGDVHIYDNHVDNIKTQLERQPKELPMLKIDDEIVEMLKSKDISLQQKILNLKPEHFSLIDYKHHPTIKGKLSTGLR